MDRFDIARNFDIAYDMVDILCGKYLGEGASRIVFESNLTPGYVVKIEKDPSTHHNILEYEFYNTMKYQKDVVKWLAPTSWMSDNGRILLQKKVSIITDRNKKNIPEKVPYFFTDIKYDNYGFIGKQFVCIDYAFSMEIACSNTTKRFKKFEPFK